VSGRGLGREGIFSARLGRSVKSQANSNSIINETHFDIVSVSLGDPAGAKVRSIERSVTGVSWMVSYRCGARLLCWLVSVQNPVLSTRRNKMREPVQATSTENTLAKVIE
jgi:hypothetical protein